MGVLRRLLCFLVLLPGPGAEAQVPFGPLPGWVSTDPTAYSTGAGWADINGDGRPDLVVANGNDIARQRVVVYFNTGTGTLSATPGWQSADIDYHGKLSIGDVNGDGWPDVAVSVYIGPTGFSSRGRVKVYLNTGGSLNATPSWSSSDSFYSFSCAFGDADGDGDPDLAVAAGEIYGNRPERNRIYFNNGGILDSLPGWMSSQAAFSYDLGWSDFDNDGDLDLAYACEGGPNRIHRNEGDSIGTNPVWLSTDSSRYANSLAIADVNNDGFEDLAISDNFQLGGEGRFKIYLNTGGSVATEPFWNSAAAGYGSAIALVDVDADGWRDLVAGGWWETCRIFRNYQGNFSTDPQWTSSTTSVAEAIVCMDADADGLDSTEVMLTGDGVRRLFLIPRAPFYGVPVVRVDGVLLSGSQYWCSAETGWLSLAVPPPAGGVIMVHAVASNDLDFAVSNWDSDVGNYLFFNTRLPVGVEEGPGVPALAGLEQNWPNPFNGETSIGYRVRGAGDGARVTLKVYDLLGREVATLVDGAVAAGDHEVRFNAAGYSSGTYFYHLRVGSFTAVKRMILLR